MRRSLLSREGKSGSRPVSATIDPHPARVKHFGRIMPSMRHPDLVVIQTLNTEPEADVAKSVLEAAGMEATIQADAAGGMRPDLASTGRGFRVLVRDQDAATARQLLKPPAKHART